MSMIDDPFDDDLEDPRGGLLTRHWWVWALVALGLTALLVLIAGSLLADARFGSQLRARACDTSPLLGIVLLGLAGAAFTTAVQLTRLRASGAGYTWDLASLAITAPVPAVLVAVTLPGQLGCSISRDLANIGLVGDALVGTAGAFVLATSVTLLGVALACVFAVAPAVTVITPIEEPPGIVELAMAEAEALERDAAATRFRGVDDEEP